ncbi:hypothetical protein GWK47_046814 [Chionoecetes opilio]|uniref:Uncharacterized protein n=1 Tax=Chionoecetes opilio TaxID=41210 RepID=A0A8J4Y629_CHIOP|nr:hypothetical protein GWK47_046814 [Chionoecetes opilio]
MYMETRANLDSWSTDNCCLHWSLKTGSITIGFLSLVWQSLMVMSGVMMVVRCPVTTNITNISLAENPLTTDLTGGTGDLVVSARNLDGEVIEDTDEYVKCRTIYSGGGGRGKEGPASGYADNVENNNSSSSGNSSTSGDHSSISTAKNSRTKMFICPWLPGPETEVLGVYTEEKLMLVAGLFIAYSGIYCILSLCVVVGSCTNSVTLLNGWVAFTSFHNLLVLASLLVPLPFTTLSHLFLSIAYFISRCTLGRW